MLGRALCRWLAGTAAGSSLKGKGAPEQVFVPTFYDDTWYNGDPLYDPADHRNFNYNHTFLQVNHLIGGFRILQHRAEDKSCFPSTRFESYVSHCWNNGHDAREPFGPPGAVNKYEIATDEYGTEGYFVDFNLNVNEVNAKLAQLKADRFYDPATREIAVDFALYNHNINQFMLGEFLFRQEPTGYVRKWALLETANLEPYNNSVDAFRLALEIIFLIMTFTYILFELYEIGLYISRGRRYFVWKYLNVWMVLRWLNFAITLAGLGMWVEMLNHPIRTDLKLPSEAYIDMEPLAKIEKDYGDLLGVNLLLIVLRFFEYTQWNRKAAFLTQAIARAWPNVWSFLVLYFFAFFGLVLCGMLMFGHTAEEWTNFGRGATMAFELITGEAGYEVLNDANSETAAVFYFVFMIIIFLLLINMFIAIVSEAYLDLTDENKSMDIIYNQYGLTAEITDWFRCRSKGVPPYRRAEAIQFLLNHNFGSKNYFDDTPIDFASLEANVAAYRARHLRVLAAEGKEDDGLYQPILAKHLMRRFGTVAVDYPLPHAGSVRGDSPTQGMGDMDDDDDAAGAAAAANGGGGGDGDDVLDITPTDKETASGSNNQNDTEMAPIPPLTKDEGKAKVVNNDPDDIESNDGLPALPPPPPQE